MTQIFRDGIISYTYEENTNTRDIDISGFSYSQSGTANNPSTSSSYIITIGDSDSGFRIAGDTNDRFFLESFLNGTYNGFYEVVHSGNINTITNDEGTF